MHADVHASLLRRIHNHDEVVVVVLVGLVPPLVQLEMERPHGLVNCQRGVLGFLKPSHLHFNHLE